MISYEKIMFAAIAGLSGFFAPLWILVLWMTIFVMFDLISGIMAAKRRGELLQSKKLRRTINKLIWYFSAILLANGLDVGILGFIALYLANFTTAIICGVELYSILENAYSITGNRVFWLLTQFTTKKIKETTDVDISQSPDK